LDGIEGPIAELYRFPEVRYVGLIDAMGARVGGGFKPGVQHGLMADMVRLSELRPSFSMATVKDHEEFYDAFESCVLSFEGVTVSYYKLGHDLLMVSTRGKADSEVLRRVASSVMKWKEQLASPSNPTRA
jgi:hypothetical protein